MNDWRDASDHFNLRHALSQLSGTPDATNACIECCDRHPPGNIALEWRSADGAADTLTFADLQALSNRAATLLAAHGIRPGDRVSGLLPRRPALVALILGTWRLGAVYQPLFTAFGPAAITQRLRAARSRVVVTDALNRPKIKPFEGAPPILLDEQILQTGSTHVAPVMRRQSDPFMLLFTSGTTGPAKMVEVPLRALAGFIGYMQHALDLRPGDRFWNIADPGWAYGLYYAVTGPLALGHATTLHDGPFTVESFVRTATTLGITNLAAAPTAYRMLMAAGPDAVAPLRGLLRVASSAGEPLNPEVIRWFERHLGVTLHDQYGQTELGMVVCNHHALRHPIRPGSAGFSSPGYRVAVVDDTATELPRGQPGVLAIDREASPLFWFTGYVGAQQQPFAGRYYLTGDTVEMHEDGSVAFIGRADDIITSSGYRIGPFDVESALVEHPAVTEAAVIGKPDPERTEIVKAFIVLHPSHAPTPALAEALQQHVRQRLSAHAYPREIAFVPSLPKTPSGKLQRFVLRAAEPSSQH